MMQNVENKETACWVESSGGYVPPRATVGVFTKHFGAAHVARAQHDNVWLPGVLIASYGHCLVSCAGVQLRKSHYQVLCNAGETWVRTHAGLDLPTDAMPVGHTQKDGVQYVGRVTCAHSGVTILGKVLTRDRRCYVFHQKIEKCFQEYEILTVPLQTQLAMPMNAIKQTVAPASSGKYRLDNRDKSAKIETVRDHEESESTHHLHASNHHSASHKTTNQTPAAAVQPVLSDVEQVQAAVQQVHLAVQPQPVQQAYRQPNHLRTANVTPAVQSSYFSAFSTNQAAVRQPYRPPNRHQVPAVKSSYFSAFSRAAPGIQPAVQPVQPAAWPVDQHRSSSARSTYFSALASNNPAVPGVQPSLSICKSWRATPIVAVAEDKGQWVASANGKVPKDAVVGGKNHLGAIYVGRVQYKESWVPGKLIPGYGRCYISVQGEEQHSKQYEVLCGGSLSWQAVTSRSKVPKSAVCGGCDEDGTELYIGRVAHGSSISVGKVYQDKCFVLYGAMEHPYSEYELLVCNPGSVGTQVGHMVAEVAPPKPSIEEDFKLVEISSANKEFESVSKMMQSSIRSHAGVSYSKYLIIKMERVWNKMVWKRFKQCRERVIQENKDANEKELFHGSYKCDEIVRQGFDERHSKSSGMFGAGVYFAEHSSKSNQYNKCRHGAVCTRCVRQMLLCRVILGNVSVYTSAQNRLAHAPPGSHSVMGVPQAMGLVYPEYIVYRGEQAFPKILITYKIIK